MHGFGIAALDEEWFISVADEKAAQFLVVHASKHRWIRDLVAVEMQDWQHGSVASGVEELVRVPCRRKRAGLGFPVADHASHEEVGIVERGSERMDDRVAQFATLVDGTRRLWRDVARHASGERELLEQFPHPIRVSADLRIYLAVRAFQPGVRDHGRAAMARAAHV